MHAEFSPNLLVPKFTKEIVADQLRDGYWLEAPDIDGDGKPDLFGYGLRLGEIYWYQNGQDWTRRLVTDGFRMPVGGDFADISGNGYSDIIVCHELYGPIGTIHDPDPTGGKIDWIENPGSPGKNETRWRRHYGYERNTAKRGRQGRDLGEAGSVQR